MSNPLVTGTGTHDLVGWGSYDMLDDSILPRVFGHLVVLAGPVVKEFHGDLFWDADSLRMILSAAFADNPDRTEASFLYCVRHSGTHIGPVGKIMFESHHYDAVLYNLTVSTDERGRWTLRVDLIGAREPHPITAD
jgi:hypothetical protein